MREGEEKGGRATTPPKPGHVQGGERRIFFLLADRNGAAEGSLAETEGEPKEEGNICLRRGK